MSVNLNNLVAQFSGLRVAVIGDAMLDIYMHGSMGRICPEAPAPIVDVGHEHLQAGGAANVASNVAALGAEVCLLSVIGADCESDSLMDVLDTNGVRTALVCRSSARRTLVKRRIVADSQTVLRADQGTKSPLDERLEAKLVDRIRGELANADIVVISDYAYGILSPGVCEAIASARHRFVLAVDSKQLPRFAAARPDVAKPNYREASQLLELEMPTHVANRAELIVTKANQLFQMTGARCVTVTLDRDGCLCLERDRPPIRVPGQPCANPRVAGAGDTFLACFALALGAGGDSELATQLANAAASIVVAKQDTSLCSATELQDRVTAHDNSMCDLPRLVRQIDADRQANKRIVLTNGCFDILHRGHVTYLHRARALGDRLVVGVNTDESIRRLKGSARPINTLVDRLSVLAALNCVDYLIAFGEATPHELIRAIRPDVFVKGGDYSRETLPEADLVEQLGGVIRILPLVENRSTTRIIDRIRSDSYVPVCESH